jgi:uncharacterized membrane protein
MIGWGAMRGMSARPRLGASLALGAAVLFAAAYGPFDLAWSTCAVLAWDTVCAVFIALVVPMMIGAGRTEITAKAPSQDEGQGFILALVIVATVASLVAVAHELALARSGDGLLKLLRVGLAAATVGLSWTMVQFIFALHYAHEYYAPEGATGCDLVAEGLKFPGDEDPDYWDFLHFSMVIGVACQTADIAFTAKALRRIGTVHGVLAFTFNTVVVALTINLLAALL